MPGIIGNDMWFDHEPTFADFMAAIQQFSRRSLLDRADNSPMLVINGGNDYFVPQADTLVFQGRQHRGASDSGHRTLCRLGGRSKMPEVIDRIVAWLPAQIGLASR
jgi:esterase FrsA